MLLGEGEDTVVRLATLALVDGEDVALRVAHIVGGHKLVARGHILVGDLLGDALAHGVVVEVEFRLVALLGADHVGDLARHRPTDVR